MKMVKKGNVNFWDQDWVCSQLQIPTSSYTSKSWHNSDTISIKRRLQVVIQRFICLARPNLTINRWQLAWVCTIHVTRESLLLYIPDPIRSPWLVLQTLWESHYLLVETNPSSKEFECLFSAVIVPESDQHRPDRGVQHLRSRYVS